MEQNPSPAQPRLGPALSTYLGWGSEQFVAGAQLCVRPEAGGWVVVKSRLPPQGLPGVGPGHAGWEPLSRGVHGAPSSAHLVPEEAGLSWGCSQGPVWDTVPRVAKRAEGRDGRTRVFSRELPGAHVAVTHHCGHLAALPRLTHSGPSRERPPHPSSCGNLKEAPGSCHARRGSLACKLRLVLGPGRAGGLCLHRVTSQAELVGGSGGEEQGEAALVGPNGTQGPTV